MRVTAAQKMKIEKDPMSPHVQTDTYAHIQTASVNNIIPFLNGIIRMKFIFEALNMAKSIKCS